MESSIGHQLSEDNWFTYNTLSLIFPYLDLVDILRYSQVCRLWNHIAKDQNFWRSVIIKNCKVDFKKMSDLLSSLNTVRLKLTGCKIDLTDGNGVKKLDSLKILQLTDCSSKFVETLAEEILNLQILHVEFMCGSSHVQMDLNFITRMTHLCELKLYCNRELQNLDDLLINLRNLNHLYLLGVKNLTFKNLNTHKLDKNITLESLALGDCSHFSKEFVLYLKSLTSLKKLRLEHCREWDMLPILRGISEMENLVTLELLEIQALENFDIGLKFCTKLKKLTIVPTTHRFSMASYNGKIFVGVISLSGTLKEFTWGFTERYLQYFKKVLDVHDAVPILRDDGEEIVTLKGLESRLSILMPGSKVTVTKSVNTGNIFA